MTNTCADARAAVAPDLSAYLPLFSEVGDLKRVRAAGVEGSVASALFVRSWSALVGGADSLKVAATTTAAATTAARLGAIDETVLAAGGLSREETREVLLAGFDAVAAHLPDAPREYLRGAVGEGISPASVDVPGFVGALARQPRAGATRPGRPRLMLEPPESHAEHCVAVAVYGVALSGAFGAEPGPVFLAGLSHHLHNAGLPDAGFAGEELLGEHLETVMEAYQRAALRELPAVLRGEVESSLRLTGHAGSPEARAFHAADVLDRVLQMRHYERQARFTTEQALEEMDLVHPGPLKDFHDAVLSVASLR